MRVRLYGIDAPEKGQDFANVSKSFITDLYFYKTVSIYIKDIDRYGRTVGIVWTVDSKNLNLELLKSGNLIKKCYIDDISYFYIN
ncbi:thermonuclease family protein [Sphingobacterium kitahiroshimense]|uniref:thermonuclease family protein n=1 Tax=Sphingobacterium kitahiroshimense TaxID=470446 RepID=UPI003D35B028